MSAAEPETDAEHVEFCRRNMQEAIDRADWDSESAEALLLSVGRPIETRLLQFVDLRELGAFDLVLPDKPWLRDAPTWRRKMLTWHRVYMHTDGSVHALSVRSRQELLRTGSVRIRAFVHGPGHVQ